MNDHLKLRDVYQQSDGCDRGASDLKSYFFSSGICGQNYLIKALVLVEPKKTTNLRTE
jgi:hypothetical protein